MDVILRNVKCEGCWIWKHNLFDKDGYGLIQYEGKLWRAHRLAYLLHYGYLTKQNVLHTCDIRSCCNPEHLYLGSQQDNLNDAVERGRTNTGTKHWNAKLTAEQVSEIRFKLALGIYEASIAKEYKVSRGCISGIKTGAKWKEA